MVPTRFEFRCADDVSNARVGISQRRLPCTSEAMGRNMTDVSGIDRTQGALARWIAPNADTMSTVPGAGLGLLEGA